MTAHRLIWSMAQKTDMEARPAMRLPRDPRLLAIAIVGVTLLIMVWFLSISSGARTEPDLGGFVRLSGWPTAIVAVGLAWTALLVTAVVTALRAPRGVAVPCMVASTLSALALKLFIPPWFRDMAYFGISTSEFTDAFLIVGGVLPGGEGTRLLIATCVVLAGLTLVVALRR
jgi:hypothetical protein